MRKSDFAGQTAPAKRGLRLGELLLFLILAALLAWTMLHLRPDSGMTAASSGAARLDLSGKLDVYAHNAAADALGDASYTRKIYTLQENAVAGPVPNPACFGTTYDPAMIADVIQRATPLLDGQEVVFDPNVEFVPNEPIWTTPSWSSRGRSTSTEAAARWPR